MPNRDSITLNTPMFDQARAEAAVRELLLAVGEDPERQGLKDTPARVARAYQEIFAGLYTDPDTVLETTFDEEHDDLGDTNYFLLLLEWQLPPASSLL
jgi:GTP cyclohydrolase I